MGETGRTRLAGALGRVNAIARKAVVRSASIQRADRELLTERGYLQECILESESPALAGRLAGAYQSLGDTDRAQQIIGTAKAAGIEVEPKNPFDKPSPVLSGAIRLGSAYAGRIHAMFMNARRPVLEVFADVTPRQVEDSQVYLDSQDGLPRAG